jgi:hypothetical protein
LYHACGYANGIAPTFVGSSAPSPVALYRICKAFYVITIIISETLFFVRSIAKTSYSAGRLGKLIVILPISKRCAALRTRLILVSRITYGVVAIPIGYTPGPISAACGIASIDSSPTTEVVFCTFSIVTLLGIKFFKAIIAHGEIANYRIQLLAEQIRRAAAGNYATITWHTCKDINALIISIRPFQAETIFYAVSIV